MVQRLGDDAIGAGMNNVAFLTRFLSGDLNACLEILINTHRIPEAAFFARTYLPSQMDALKTEQFLEQRRQQLPASAYSSLPNNWERHPVEEMRQAEQNDQFHHVTPAKVSFVEEEKEVEETNELVNLNPSASSLLIPEPEVIAAASQPKNLLDDDEEDFQPAVSESAQGTSQLDQDLELDLENLELDDNVDTSEVNLDDDLLDD